MKIGIIHISFSCTFLSLILFASLKLTFSKYNDDIPDELFKDLTEFFLNSSAVRELVRNSPNNHYHDFYNDTNYITKKSELYGLNQLFQAFNSNQAIQEPGGVINSPQTFSDGVDYHIIPSVINEVYEQNVSKANEFIFDYVYNTTQLKVCFSVYLYPYLS